MAVTYHAGNIIRGTTAERTGGTWTNLPAGWLFIESDGLAIYRWSGSAWAAIGGYAKYAPYNYLVFLDGSTWYVKSGLTNLVVNSNASLTTMLQYALDNLTAARTQKEIVKVIGTGTVSTITIPSYSILDLTAAKITQASATNLNMFINNDTSGGNTQIEISGGVIDGNKAGQSLDAVPYNTRNTINLTKVTNSAIYGTYIVNSNSSGIYLDKCFNVNVDRNSIVTPRKCGIAAFGTTAGDGAYIWMTRNYIDTPTENGIATTSFTDLFIETNEIIAPVTVGINCNGMRVHIRRNHIKDSTTIGISIGTEGSYLGDYCEIIDNYVDGAKGGGIQCNASVGGDYLVVKGNKCRGAASGQSTTASGLRFTHCHNGTCEDNKVWNWQGTGISVEGHNATALGRLGDMDNTIVCNNICWDNGGNTGGAAAARVGISLSGDVGYINNVHVYGNRCYDSGVATQLYGLRYANTTDSYIHDNDFVGNVTSGIQDGGGNI